MSKEPKLDFGPTKKDHGWFYYVWNWKKYLFYIILIGITGITWFEAGFLSALVLVCCLLILQKIGKFL